MPEWFCSLVGMNVSDVEFKIVTDDDELTEPGRALVFEYPDKTLGLILCCPQCGKAGTSSTGNHKYNEQTKSVTPSIIHDKEILARFLLSFAHGTSEHTIGNYHHFINPPYYGSCKYL